MATLAIDDTEDRELQPRAPSLEVSKEELAMYREAFDGDPLPSSMASVSYWYLRRIKDAVVKGGFLNKNLLFPRDAWYRKKAKFSGIAAKISFLKDITSTITVHMEPLIIENIPSMDGAMNKLITKIKAYRGMQTHSNDVPASSTKKHVTTDDLEQRDLNTLIEINKALTRTRDAFIASQNQLAKSFNFINEEEQDDCLDTFDEIGAGVNEGNYSDNRVLMESATDAEGTLPPPPAAVHDKAGAGGGLVASLGNLGLGIGSAVVGGVGKGLTEGMSMVGNLGKNVKKIAEVGISRMNASVSSMISDDELQIYTDLVIDTTERAQIFDAWFWYCEGLRTYLLEKECNNEQQPESVVSSRLLMLAESGLTSLLVISKFMKEVVCVLLLRELEDLLKSYVKMQLALALHTGLEE